MSEDFFISVSFIRGLWCFHVYLPRAMGLDLLPIRRQAAPLVNSKINNAIHSLSQASQLRQMLASLVFLSLRACEVSSTRTWLILQSKSEMLLMYRVTLSKILWVSETVPPCQNLILARDCPWTPIVRLKKQAYHT